MCNTIADVALQADNSKLAYYALEFLYRWIHHGEIARPPTHLSVDKGLVVSALGATARTYNSNLLDVSWSILRRSLPQKRVPSPETYLAKIYAYASIGNLQRAFATLNEFETVYGRTTATDSDLFSPFTSLHPLVVACCRNGFSTLDQVTSQEPGES
ncbi:pentatricopeptide repeat-containing protein At1g26460, mitochondrial-like [Asparagus officinalis]|uniref:pentatricopeptide repeat-containing protein At1g26460, mitochondrial-like n=1 Tax=Asparagus officinalis TaxID=4686 RepID=UPI00098E5036|nr:pentatricopeptide repeat-containing protein At1g26460, mitochondrial-like [Asparagus officinalis]